MNRDKKPDEVKFNIIVGKNIRYLRKLNKLTQSELADAIGIAYQQVSKYEQGTNGMLSYILHKVAHKVFNISTDVLADPQMIIKHKGFSDVVVLGEAKTPQDPGYLKPQRGIMRLEEIKKEAPEWL